MTPNPRTILYINATAELGGTDTDLFATISALDRRRFRPIVALPHRGPFDDAYAAMGVDVIHLPFPVVNRAIRPADLLLRLWPSVQAFRRVIQSRQVDLVYTNSLLVLSGGLAARLTRRPALWHSGELLDRPRLVGQMLYAFTGALATQIVVSSAAVQARFPRWAQSRVTVLRNGIDLSRFHPETSGAAVRQELGVPPGAPLVGFVGRFIPWKGADQFVRTAARVAEQVPDAHFVIAGSRLAGYEAYVDSVRALIRSLGLAKRTTMVENRTDVPELMAAMDIFVHCSTVPEPFGIVIVEAMASGKPVVAVNAGGVPEIIGDPAAGMLVPIKDVEATARAVTGLLRDPARARAMGAMARAHVERHFEITAVTRRAEAIYEQAISGVHSAPA